MTNPHALSPADLAMLEDDIRHAENEADYVRSRGWIDSAARYGRAAHVLSAIAAAKADRLSSCRSPRGRRE